MSDDEVFLLVGGIVLALWITLRWCALLVQSPQGRRAQAEFLWLILAPLAAFAGILVVIIGASSADVRDAPSYIALYCAAGIVWFTAGGMAMRYLGISARDDAVERRNLAAAIVVMGAVFAHAAIYAGANIGNGPGWWTVLAAAAIGSGAWLALWSLVEACCGISEKVTVDRDVPAAIRLAGYAFAMGIVCGRGAAGDWTSLDRTMIEFAAAWPVLPMTGAAIAIENFSRANMPQGSMALSTIVAVAYLGVAVAAVHYSGALPHNPEYDYLGRPASFEGPSLQPLKSSP